MSDERMPSQEQERLRTLESLIGTHEIAGARVEVRRGLGAERFDVSVIRDLREGVAEVITYKIVSTGFVQRELDLEFVSDYEPTEREFEVFGKRGAELDEIAAVKGLDALLAQLKL